MPQEFHFSQEQANSLIRDIEFSLKSMSADERENAYLLSSSRGSVVISYNEQWHPFIGQSRRVNAPGERTYLRFDNPLLRQIAEAFRDVGREQAGGRVFLKSSRVFFVDGDRKIDLIQWDWPGVDLTSEV